MKASEFYEKYIKIQTKNGLVSPRPLRQDEKDFLDNAAINQNCQQVILMSGRKRTRYIDVGYINKELDKLPKFFTPHIQPKLDKYGNIENEIKDNTTNQK